MPNGIAQKKKLTKICQLLSIYQLLMLLLDRLE